jgi:hypothetical protein
MEKRRNHISMIVLYQRSKGFWAETTQAVFCSGGEWFWNMIEHCQIQWFLAELQCADVKGTGYGELVWHLRFNIGTG